MNPIRKRRLLLILALLAASGVAAALVTLALRENITYLYTPSQVYAGEAAEQAVFRLGGMVAKNSLKREQGTLKVQFGVTDGDAVMTAHYEGILPDLFRENQAVIATGRRERATRSSPPRCWPNTTSSTCRAKWPRPWARRTKSTRLKTSRPPTPPNREPTECCPSLAC